MANKVNKASLPQDDNTLGITAHALGIVFPVFGTLIMYLLYKDTASTKLKQNIINAFNFQLSVTIYSLALVITFIGAFLLPILALATLILSIMGIIEANKGGVYKYPLTIEIIKS
jgi:uncharacterized Tic20 family protein